MILSVGGIKGGSGKTTLAINIAVARALKKHRVLLVDADEQRSATMWSTKREDIKTETEITTIHLTGSSVLTQVKKMTTDYDDIIIDVGGRENSSLRAALLVCDTFLTPFRPRSLDIWTIENLEKTVEEALTMNSNMNALSVLNQADSRGIDNIDAFSILKECRLIQPLKCIISQRKIFANSANEGMGILEYHPSDEKGERELKKLVSKLY